MDFLRRLFGGQPDSATGAAKLETARTGSQAPEIAAPGTPIVAATQSPIVQAPARRPGDDKRSTNDKLDDVREAALTDPTPAFGVTRQLAPLEPLPAKPGKHITYGLASDIGMIRTNNQDSMFAFFSSNTSAEEQPDFGLFIVADGMGGHHDGELASAIATRIIAQHVIENFYLPVLKSTSQGEDRPLISEVLSEAVQKANAAVADQIPEGGTTVTSAAVLSDRVYIAHVGDSRAYLISSEGIEQITRDHSLVQRLIELDQLTPEEAAAHPQRNVLYRAIGQSENLEIDAVTRRLPPGSRLLVCCDGLWNQVSESNILQIVQGSKSPQEACDHLITVANDRGGPDNITVILVQVPG